MFIRKRVRNLKITIATSDSFILVYFFSVFGHLSMGMSQKKNFLFADFDFPMFWSLCFQKILFFFPNYYFLNFQGGGLKMCTIPFFDLFQPFPSYFPSKQKYRNAMSSFSKKRYIFLNNSLKQVYFLQFFLIIIFYDHPRIFPPNFKSVS